jgi:ketopantoate reductase
MVHESEPLFTDVKYTDSTTDVFESESTRAIHAKPNSTHTPSMMLDAQVCKPFEVEVQVIIGEVVRMAKSVGVDIPVSTSTDCV